MGKKLKNKIQQYLIIASIAAAVIFLVTILYLLKDYKVDLSKGIKLKNKKEEKVFSGKEIYINNVITQNENNNLISEIVLPVSLGNLNSQMINDHIDLIPQYSILTTYDNSISYKIYAQFLNKEYMTNELSIRIDLINNNGEVIYSDFVNVLSEQDQYVYPGDVIPFKYTIKNNKRSLRIKQVVLSIDSLKEEPQINTDNELIPLNYSLSPGSSQDYKLNLFQVDNFKKAGQEKWFQYLIIRFKNSGNKSIKLLKINIKWLDKNNKILSEEQAFVIGPTGPFLRPNQTLTYRFIAEFPEKIKNYDNFIINIEEIE